jgi:flagellar biosynthesis component FlhA
VLVPAQLRRKNLEYLEPLLLAPELERRLADSLGAAAAGALDPQLAMAIRDTAERYAEQVPPQRAALLCTSTIRPLLADFLGRSGVRLSVYSYAEVPAEIRLVPAEVIKEETLA